MELILVAIVALSLVPLLTSARRPAPVPVPARTRHRRARR